MCLEKLHRGELVHRNGSGEVLHLAESNSRRHHQTSLKFVDRQTPAAVRVSTFLRHPVYGDETDGSVHCVMLMIKYELRIDIIVMILVK